MPQFKCSFLMCDVQVYVAIIPNLLTTTTVCKPAHFDIITLINELLSYRVDSYVSDYEASTLFLQMRTVLSTKSASNQY